MVITHCKQTYFPQRRKKYSNTTNNVVVLIKNNAFTGFQKTFTTHLSKIAQKLKAFLSPEFWIHPLYFK